MSYVNTFTHEAHTSKTGIFASMKASLKTWNANRKTRNALNALSDRELDDIGLTRGDIDRLTSSK